MEHSVSGYVFYVSMWFNTKFVRLPHVTKNIRNIALVEKSDT